MSWKDIDITSSQAIKRKFIWTHRKIWTRHIVPSVCAFRPLLERGLYFLPQQSSFLHTLGNKATNHLCASHLTASTPRRNGFLLLFMARLKPWGKLWMSPTEPSQSSVTAIGEGRHDQPGFGQIPTHGVTTAAFIHSTRFILREEHFPEDGVSS